MSLTDEEFREEYKPKQVPAHFDTADTQENKLIFALAQLGDATSEAVIAQLEMLEPGFSTEQTRAFVTATLKDLYDNGHLTGSEHGGHMHYNLSKITEANDGEAQQNFLTPGLDE